MRTRLLLAAALLACAAPRPRPPKGAVVLSVEGKVENGPFRYGQDDLASLPRRAFDASAPFAARPARFEGVSVAPLLTDTIELAPGGDTVVVRDGAGSAAPIPVTIVRYLRPVLADRADGGPVADWRTGVRGPVLAWPNQGNPGLDSDPRVRWWWLSGVTRLEVQSWAATYGRALRVPPGAPDRARLGAEAIATDCIVCHSVRNVGGTRGPPLTAALLPDGVAFARTAGDHAARSIGDRTAPPIDAARAADIATFLKAADRAGPLRDDESPPEPPEERAPSPDEAPPPIPGGFVPPGTTPPPGG